MLKHWLWLEINVVKFSAFAGKSYMELPKVIQKKKAVLNIQNNDDQCFKWCILAALHPIHWSAHPYRVQQYYPFREELIFDGIKFPVSVNQIPLFESLNDISVNVYGLERELANGKINIEVVGPLYFTTSRKARHVNLLLLEDDEDVNNTHYCLIRDMSRLMRSQISRREHKKWLCDGCLMFFGTESKLVEHQKFDCNHVRVSLPDSEKIRKDKYGNDVPENLLKFEAFEKKLKTPFVVYADFESLLQTIGTADKIQNFDESFSFKTHKHVPYSFAYYIKCSFDDSLSKFVPYRGPDAAKVFIESLEKDIQDLYNKHIKIIHPLSMTDQDEIGFQNSTHCHICEKPFGLGEEKVRDHDHLLTINNYRGAAHSTCNLNFQIPKFTPIFFHNLSGYDAHLFLKDLASFGSKLDVIAQNKERYITFSKHIHVDTVKDKKGHEQQVFWKLRFLDSFRFMAKSLDKLAQNLHDSQCVEIQKHYPLNNEFQLIRKKGVFPYEYLDSWEKLEDTKLPEKNAFYDSLKREEIKDEDYERACKVWDMFGCRTLGEYSDLYLKSDVLLLSDVFEQFRQVCMRVYLLDPCNHVTAPSLAWNAALKCTGVELELLTDIDMHHFIKKGIRGGVSQCSVRRAVANNKYTPNYDPTKPTSYIAYLDATNLYGWAMQQYLPTGGFRFLTESEQAELDIQTVPDDAEEGFILEVDLFYPEHLHDTHNELPFCPEPLIPPSGKLPKLIPNLKNKSKYVIHYRNLKQALANGLILTKIHRVLTFRQSPWLRKYIELNTNLRNQATNEFEKDFYKLMNNAVFGKTMENVDKRVDVKLLTHWENIGRKLGANAYVAKPYYKNKSIFSNNFVAIQLNKRHVRYSKPIFVGFSILDVSKTCMYDFYYGHIKQKYGDKALLLYTDTDSLILSIETENFYDDMKNNIDLYDTSNYKPGNMHGIPVTASVLGRMKDEYKGKVPSEMIGTGAKAYMVDVEGKLTKKAKGVRKCAVKDLTADDYRDVVDSMGDTLTDADGNITVHNGRMFKDMHVFRTQLHEVFTLMTNKVALSYFDDKRFLIPNSYRTLAWGHKDISEHQP